MINSREVFAKRREGKLDEAYDMACQLIKNSQRDEWDIKALAWCVIDLIKRDAKAGNYNNLQLLKQQLLSLNINFKDDILIKNIDYAAKLCKSNINLIMQAKNLSKNGQNQEAAKIYYSLLNNGDYSEDIQTSLGWELYKLSKAILKQKSPNFNQAKTNLNQYFKLKAIPKPSLLHSCILNLAYVMAKNQKLLMDEFVKIWNLENLTSDDYKPYRTSDGKTFPSLAEKVIQLSMKQAVFSNSIKNINYIFPFMEKCSNNSPNNIWLKLNKLKALISLNKVNNEALSIALELVKNKPNEFWAWELFGDVHKEISKKNFQNCYCKALLCSENINFVYKVKLKLAHIMVNNEDYPRAKLEIEQILNYRNKNNMKIPEDVSALTSQNWYKTSTAVESNFDFYSEHASKAEELLYRDLPWTNGIIGKKFYIPNKPNKPKRELYIETMNDPLEISLPETKLPIIDAKPGTAVKIKGEYDIDKIFQVYKIKKRDSSEKWDIFKEYIGVVDHINKNKELMHFIVDKFINGILYFSDLYEKFQEFDTIAVRVIKKKNGNYYPITARKTDTPAPESILKSFNNKVIKDNGLGFTENNIFIPPPLLEEHHIQNGDKIAGKAILNYNKKRSEWSWKAIKIMTVTNIED